MRYALAFCLSLMLLGRASAAAPEPPPTLEELLAAFKSAPGVEAKFTEKKHIAMLAAPLTSEGVIYYTAPGQLARWVTKPTPGFQIIDPQRVRLGSGDKVETLDLKAKPQVRVFVESFVTLLSGDRAALAKTYTLDFTAELPEARDLWRLKLVPKVAPLAKVVAHITLEGSGIGLRAMRIVEVGGDETVTTFTSVDTQRTFTADEKKTLFKQ